MMFDPPDYPYKELSETYDPHSLLFENDTNHEVSSASKNKDSLSVTANLENQLLFSSNESGRFFNIDEATFSQETEPSIQTNTEVYVVRTENLFNYEPTLLDENTVNQFLLPVIECSEEKKDSLNIGPDELALHSCAICHEIFTTEADLLDHTISHHTSDKFDPESNVSLPDLNSYVAVSANVEEINNDHFNNGTEWLVCRFCERVLSTAFDVEPNEQLCCLDESGKGSVLSQKLMTMHVCETCNGLFASGDALDRHTIICFTEEPSRCNDLMEERVVQLSLGNSEVCFTCGTCDKQYENADHLKAHSLECQKIGRNRSGRRSYTSGGNNKMWNCGSCNQLFMTARELYRHKRGEDRPDGAPLTAYVCEECDKVLGSMCALHTHKKMHRIFKPGYPCRVCGRRFNQSGHLAIHMRMHTGERPYPCDLCKKAFKVKVERDDHRRTHTGERPFACSACPKTFTAAARLREHARIHTDQRPYRCGVCGAAFRRPYARTVHTLIHTGEKPHECDICGTAFRRSGDMWKHKRTLHGSQPSVEGDPRRI